MVEPFPVFVHILAQTRQNVELLVAHKQISAVDGAEILSRLRRSPLEDACVASLTHGTQQLSVSPAPSKVEARATWEWSSEDPNDLAFEAGEIIEVVSETNAEWWTGRNRRGKQGLFPSSYVVRLPPRTSSPALVPGPRHTTTSRPSLPQPLHGAAPPSMHFPPPCGYYAPPPGPPPGAISYSYAPPAGAPTPQPGPRQVPGKNYLCDDVR